MTFHGKVTGNILNLVYQKEFDQLVRNLNDKKVELSLEEARSDRTQAQNRLYWGVYLKEISKHTGDTESDLHAYFKQTFLSEARVLKSGEWVRVIGTTTRLKPGEFSEYLEKIHQWALEQFPEFVLPSVEDYLSNFKLEP